MRRLLLCLLLLPLSLSRADDVLNAHSAILVGPDAKAIFDQTSRPAPSAKEGLWMPIAEQVNAMWKAFSAFAGEHPKLLSLPVESYYRQYVGFLRGGHRYIYLNAFPESMARDVKSWTHRPLLTAEGGSTCFGVVYNVETGQISDFQSNGVASNSDPAHHNMGPLSADSLGPISK